MKLSIQQRIARQFSGNVGLNRKALAMKQSWDEIGKLLKVDNTKKK